MDEIILTLNNPLTEEQWDAITDVDFDCTNEIIFHTKHGKTVKFTKEQQWTPVTKDLPKVMINPITGDYKKVLCSCDFGNGLEDVRAYQYDGEHFYNGPGIMDKYVKAWKPYPELWKGEQDE